MPKRSLLIAISVCALVSVSPLAKAQSAGFTEYRNERFGFRLTYPVDVFEVGKASEAGDGQVFVSPDGRARLLVGALTNDSGQSPASYQAYIARESYADYRIHYQRLASGWFVLSGEGNGNIFYEKVIFSCAGGLINSFAIIYPSEERRVFDPIVEGLEATFQPGRNCRGRSRDQLRGETGAIPANRGPRSAMADRIARQRGHDVLVVLRRASPPYDRKVLRGYVSR